MEQSSLAMVSVAVVASLVVLRIIIGVFRASAKLMMWAVVAVAAAGIGYVWLSGA